MEKVLKRRAVVRKNTKTYQGNPCRKYGHTEKYVSNNGCVMCYKINGKKYYKENKDEILKNIRKYQENHQEDIKKYRKDNAERKRVYAVTRYALNAEKYRKEARERYTPEQGREYRRANKEKIKKQKQKWAKKNRKKCAHDAAKYRAMKMCQTPPWADLEKIEEIYLTCPDGYDVDHIHPLSKGGLHVHYNLQHLLSSENRRKYNKIL